MYDFDMREQGVTREKEIRICVKDANEIKRFKYLIFVLK